MKKRYWIKGFLCALVIVVLSTIGVSATEASDTCSGCGNSHSGYTCLNSDMPDAGALATGNYYLTGDLTLTTNLTVSGTVTLCLNGYTLTGATDSTSSVITINAGATLNLYGGSGMTTDWDTTSIPYTQVSESNENTTPVYSGAITGGNATKGGAIYVDGGTLNMYSGTLIGNQVTGIYGSSEGHGGAIYGNGADINIYGGTIVGNSAAYYGGGIYAYNGSVTLGDSTTVDAATIEYNTGSYGGGIHANGSTVLLDDGGYLQYNTASTYGGGIYVQGGATVNVDGTDIQNNSVQSSTTEGGHGGGIYATGSNLILIDSFLTLNEAKGGNNTDGNGGGIYATNSSAITMSADGTDTWVSENTATGNGGGIYMYNSTTMTISSGHIHDNLAQNGGGIYANDTCTITMSGGSIHENKATNDSGGGIYAFASTVKLSIEPYIYNNITSASKASNCYLSDNSSSILQIAKMNENENSIGISSYNEEVGATMASVDTTVYSYSINTTNFFYDNGTYTLEKSADADSLVLALASSGGDDSSIEVSSQSTLEDALEELSTDGGTITLTAPIELDTFWQSQDLKNITLDGGGYTITVPAGYYLFTKAEGCTIQNLTIAGTDIEGVINNASGTVSLVNVHNTASISVSTSTNNSNAYAGGLIHYVSGTVSIKNCTNIGAISASTTSAGAYAGGLVGYNDGSLYIESSINGGAVSATNDYTTYSFAGGLVGYWDISFYDGTITTSYNYGTVYSGAQSAGGLVGYIKGSLANTYTLGISYSYNAGMVEVDADDGAVGGLVGYVGTQYVDSAYDFTDGTTDHLGLEEVYNSGYLHAASEVSYGLAMLGTASNAYYADQTGLSDGLGTAVSHSDLAKHADTVSLSADDWTFNETDYQYPTLTYDDTDHKLVSTAVALWVDDGIVYQTYTGDGKWDTTYAPSSYTYTVGDLSKYVYLGDSSGSTTDGIYDQATLEAALDSIADGGTITLTGDITLNSDWEAPALSNITFDGGGHTITVYKGTYLFTTVEDSTIQNLVIDGKDISGLIETVQSGETLNVSLTNVHNYASILSEVETTLGGLIGTVASDATATLTNCSNGGSVTTDDIAGGLVGSVIGTLIVEQCYNYGRVSSTSSISGGLVGSVTGTVTINYSYNSGYIAGVTAGGLVGSSTGATINFDEVYNAGYLWGTTTTTTNALSPSANNFTSAYYISQTDVTSILGTSTTSEKLLAGQDATGATLTFSGDYWDTSDGTLYPTLKNDTSAGKTISALALWVSQGTVETSSPIYDWYYTSNLFSIGTDNGCVRVIKMDIDTADCYGIKNSAGEVEDINELSAEAYYWDETEEANAYVEKTVYSDILTISDSDISFVYVNGVGTYGTVTVQANIDDELVPIGSYSLYLTTAQVEFQKSTAYTLGTSADGTFYTLDGDESGIQYASGITFYVPENGTYQFIEVTD